MGKGIGVCPWESIACKPHDHFSDSVSDSGCKAASEHAFFQITYSSIHLLGGTFVGHSATQLVGFTWCIATAAGGYLHNLLLPEDHPLGLLENLAKNRMWITNWFDPGTPPCNTCAGMGGTRPWPDSPDADCHIVQVTWLKPW